MNWHPDDLIHCVGSTWLAYFQVAMAAEVVIYYLLIARLWQQAMSAAGPNGRNVWGSMRAIFLFCAFAGYAPNIIMLFHPPTAIVCRTIALIALNVASPMFLFFCRNYSFTALGGEMAVGEELVLANKKSLSDADLAGIARVALEKAVVAEKKFNRIVRK